jgi:uncharacterized protein
MAERDGYIPGVPCWIDTSQPDPEAAVDFYGGLFGWEFEDTMPPGSQGARSFYGSVFGWQTGAIGGGAVGWTLPGYGDWLEREHHPQLRRQMAEAGAPEGFEDVVASIIPIADDQPDTPAHWSVTLAVADADATAAKATELGGRVIVPPFDAPWVRMTVLADPQGATFVASQFVPENQSVPAQADAVGGS